MSLILKILFLGTLISAPAAFAWPPTWGMEFNWSNDAMRQAMIKRNKGTKGVLLPEAQIPTPDGEGAWTKIFADAVRIKCKGDCEVIQHSGKWDNIQEYTVKFKDGWYFNISADPKVVEIQTQPATLEDFRAHSDVMNKFLFEVADELKLDRWDGNVGTLSAHLNEGVVSAFGDDAESFLRYIVDHSNQPELGLGVFYEGQGSLINSPPVSHLLDKQQKAMESVIRDFQKKRITTIPEIVDRVISDVFSSTPYMNDAEVRLAGAHYQSLGLEALHSLFFPQVDKPLEMRGIRQPENYKDFLSLAELWQKRTEYILSQKGVPLRFIRRPKVDTYTPSELASRFHVFVSEMGEDPKKYRKLLLPEVRKAELDAFVSGKFSWNNADDIKLLDKYLLEAETSPFIKERIRDITLVKVDKDGKGKLLIEEKLRQINLSPPADTLIGKAKDFVSSCLKILGKIGKR